MVAAMSIALFAVTMLVVTFISAMCFASAIAPYNTRRSTLNYALFGLCLLVALATASRAKSQPFTFVDPSPDPVIVQPPPVVVQPTPIVIQPASVFFAPPAVGYGYSAGSYGANAFFRSNAFFGSRIGSFNSGYNVFRFNAVNNNFENRFLGDRFFNGRANNRAFFRANNRSRINVRVNVGRRFIR